MNWITLLQIISTFHASHNSYFALLAETGLAGSIPFIVFILLLTLSGFKSAVQLARRGEIWAIAIFASFVGMSIHLWSLSGLTNTSTWFVYGLVAGLIQRNAFARDTARSAL